MLKEKRCFSYMFNLIKSDSNLKSKKVQDFCDRIFNHQAVMEIFDFLQCHLEPHIKHSQKMGTEQKNLFDFTVYDDGSVCVTKRPAITYPKNSKYSIFECEYNYVDKGMKPLSGYEKNGLELALVSHLIQYLENNEAVISDTIEWGVNRKRYDAKMKEIYVSYKVGLSNLNSWV